LGVNFFRGVPAGPLADGWERIATPEGEFAIAAGASEGQAALVVHPREIILSRERPAGSARNVFMGTIEQMVPQPPERERGPVMLTPSPALVAEVTRPSIDALGLHAGETVFASFKAAGVTVIR